MARTYRVSEFARLAGVTVRTLHHYHHTGLLQPSLATEGGHRLYQWQDLLRLQQILTLKWMGFTLEQVKDILDSPNFDLRQSLAAQKEAVEARIARLREAAMALERALALVDRHETEEIEAETVAAILRAVIEPESYEWVKRYYSEEAMAGIHTRRLAYGPGILEQAQRDWQEVFAAFERLRGQPPDSPAVQAAAARMYRLVEAFTGGDPEARAGLERLVTDAEAGRLPPSMQGYTPYGDADAELRLFMQRAFDIYRKRNEK